MGIYETPASTGRLVMDRNSSRDMVPRHSPEVMADW